MAVHVLTQPLEPPGIAEMLEAIETRKARALGEVLARHGRGSVADLDIHAALRRIPELCARFRVHYLTYYLDEKCAHVVLVTRKGKLYAPEPIPLSRDAIRAAATRVDPRQWGRTDISKLLSPLVAWLAPLFSDHTVAPDDHLCVSADENMASVPFGYLWLGKRRLIDVLSTSRIHNASQLVSVLSRQPLRPSAYLGLATPSDQDAALKYLGSRLPGETLTDRLATIEALRATPRRELLIHLSTNDAVLTPEGILDGKLDLCGSHVSLTSCVSGPPREGFNGDALGVDWAMIQARAASVIASHWDVDPDIAAVFLTTFYRCWLDDGLSRRDAMDATVAELKARGGRYAAPESWAAFSLTGDWR
ncbi:MAG: CHAT domain-containing protein [Gemmatimonadaceae bacterium]